MTKPERRFILDFKMAPGDVSMLTSLVRDIKLTYDDRYAVDVRTNFPAIWRHNPHITKLGRRDAGVEYYKLGYYDSLKAAHKGVKRHFCTAFHHEFQRRTGIHVPCHYPKPDYHFSDYEKENPLIKGRYWIVVPGGKLDMTTKFWSIVRYQEVVNRLRQWGLRFVQEGATKRLCHHPPLENVFNVIGQTSVRDLMVNILHAEGVICAITFQMHAAAAMNKPCVVIAGGREEPWFEAYTNDYDAFGSKAAKVGVPHKFLHTVGLLGCCRNNGCWQRRVMPLRDKEKDAQGRLMDNSLCKDVGRQSGLEPTVLPHCMDMIRADHVIEAVMSYYESGQLPPP
jgi:hypothetical protein